MANNSDGSVVVDILLDGDKAKKYWENFSQYMAMSTKQLEKNLMASYKKINELGDAYTKVSQDLQNVRNRRADISKIIEPYNSELQKIEEIKKEIKKLEDERTEYLKSLPSNVLDRKQKVTDSGTLTTLTQEETQRTDNLTKQIELLRQQQAEEEAIVRNIELQKGKYDEITLQVQQLQSERKIAYDNLKQETTTFVEMNTQYAQMKQNEQEITAQAKENNKAVKDTANNTKKVADNTKKIKHNTANIGANIKSGVAKLADGLKKIMRMSLALIGIRSIYAGISGVFRTWLNSEDELAQKTKANLENLKLSFAQMLQPAITWIINGLNNVLALAGAIVKQFTNLNIFAKKTAQSTAQTSKNAQNTLASFDKIDVLQKNDSGASGDTAIQPDDMNELMGKYEELANKIKGIFETIFDPFKKAWDEKGADIIDSIQTSFESLKGLGTAIGGSIAEVWTNGTIEKTLKSILGIIDNIIKVIGNVAEAWENAWREDDKGTKIVQNVADIINDIIGFIETLTGMWEKLTASEGYKKFIDGVTKGIEVITEGIKFIVDTWKEMFDENADKWTENLNKVFGSVGDTLKSVFEIIQKIMENEEFKSQFKKYVEIIGEAVTILTDWWAILADILALITNPDWEHFSKLFEDIGTIFKDFGTLLNDVITQIVKDFKMDTIIKWVKEKTGEVTKAVAEKFEDLKKNIPQKIEDMKNSIVGKFETIRSKVAEKIEELRKSAREKFEDIKKAIPDKIENAKSTLINKFETIRKNILIKVENLRTGIRQKFEDVKKGIPEKVEALKKSLIEKFENIIANVRKKIEDLRFGARQKFEDIKKAIPDKIQEMKKTLEQKFENIKNSLTGENGIVSKINKKIREKFEDIKTAIPNKIAEMKTFMWGKFDNIRDTIGNKISEITGKITTPFEGIGTTIQSSLGTAYENFIKPKLNTIIEAVENMINRIIGGLNKIPEKINAVLNNEGVKKVLSKFGIDTSNVNFHIQEVQLKRLARGGIVTQATPAIVGEARSRSDNAIRKQYRMDRYVSRKIKSKSKLCI